MTTTVAPSILVKDELLASGKAALLADPDLLLYYRGGPSVDWTHNVPESDWGTIHRTVLNDGQPIGFFYARVDRETNNITNLGAVSFRPKSVIYMRALLHFVESLRGEFRQIRWCVVDDNPARRIWRKYADSHGGREIGRFPDDARLVDGTIHDQVWYWVPGVAR